MEGEGACAVLTFPEKSPDSNQADEIAENGKVYYPHTIVICRICRLSVVVETASDAHRN